MKRRPAADDELNWQSRVSPERATRTAVTDSPPRRAPRPQRTSRATTIGDSSPSATAAQTEPPAPGVYAADAFFAASSIQLRALDDALLQFRDAVAGRTNTPHQVATEAVAGAGEPLPYLEQIQRAFGHHDVGGVRAHRGPESQRAAEQLGAHAFATGNNVVLGAGGQDLYTVAHEAAHVVQQRAGVSLKGGLGQVGDRYERHADQVADRVVQGRCAQELLDQFAPTRPQKAMPGALQRRAIFGRTGAASSEIVSGLLRSEDPAAISTVHDALRFAIDNAVGTGVPDEVRFGIGSDSYTLTMERAETERFAQRAAARLGELSDCDATGRNEGAERERTAAAEGTPESRAAAPRAQTHGRQGRERRAHRSQTVQGMGGLSGALGSMIGELVPHAGQSVNGILRVRVAVDGVVLTIGLTVSASRDDEGRISVPATSTFRVGLGTTESNANLESQERIRVRASSHESLGDQLSNAIRLHFVHLGEGPLPSPALSALAQALGGPMGSLLAMGDTGVRFVMAFVDGETRNPGYRWLTDRLWGAGFAADVCRRGSDGDYAESTRGGALTANGSSGADGPAASGSLGLSHVVRETCGDDGQVTSDEHTDFSASVTASRGPWRGSGRVQIPLRRGAVPTFTVSVRATTQVQDRRIAMGLSALTEALGEGHDVLGDRNRSLAEAMLNSGPLVTGARHSLLAAAGEPGSRAGLEITLTVTPQSARLTMKLTQSLRVPETGALTADLTSGQVVVDTQLFQ